MSAACCPASTNERSFDPDMAWLRSFFDQLVRVVAVRIQAEAVHGAMNDLPRSPYLAGWAAAAEYVQMPVSTLKHQVGVPKRKLGGTVLFRRDELDMWLDAYFCGSRRFHRSAASPDSRMGAGRGGGSEMVDVDGGQS